MGTNESNFGDLNRNIVNSTSLDNLMDIYRKNGFPRVDSEDQFRKFMERVPSVQSLVPLGVGGTQTQLQADQFAHHITQFQNAHAASGSMPFDPSSLQLPLTGELKTMTNIPRVKSLETLRHALNNLQGIVKEENNDPNSSDPMAGFMPTEQASAGQLGPMSAPLNLGLLPGSSLLLAPSLTAGYPGAPRVSGRTQPPGKTTSDSEDQMNSEAASQGQNGKSKPTNGGSQSKNDLRRQRRMLSNRESARRSRKRKQENLVELQREVANAEKQRDDIASELQKLKEEHAIMQQELLSLRQENEMFKQGLMQASESVAQQQFMMGQQPQPQGEAAQPDQGTGYAENMQ